MSSRQTFEEKREILCSKTLVKLAKQEDALSKSIKAVAGAQEKGALRALLNGVRKDIKDTTKTLDYTQRDLEWQRTVVLPLVDHLIETAASWKGASITPEIVEFLKDVGKYADTAFKTYDALGDISKVSARLDSLLQTSPNSAGQAIEVSQWYPLQKERQAVADFMWDTLVSELTKESKVGTFRQYATDTENLTHFMDEYSALAQCCAAILDGSTRKIENAIEKCDEFGSNVKRAENLLEKIRDTTGYESRVRERKAEIDANTLRNSTVIAGAKRAQRRL